jgi:hypothetical protein
MNWVTKGLAILLTIFFSVGLLLCVGVINGMQHSMPMSEHCQMTGNAQGCNSSADHFSYWNHILSVIPTDFVALLLAVTAACACVWLVSRSIWNQFVTLVLFIRATSPPKLYVPRHSLQEAFSNGILHPKRY